MLQYRYFLLFFIIVQQVIATEHFQHKVVPVSFPFQETKVTYKDGDTVIGYIHYRRVLYTVYVLHSFYVYPQYRGKGYGKKILSWVIHFLAENRAYIILIQPGPFELDSNGKTIKVSSQQEIRTCKLVSLYKQMGFMPVGWWLQKLTSGFYRIVGIDEDAHCLMAKTYCSHFL